MSQARPGSADIDNESGDPKRGDKPDPTGKGSTCVQTARPTQGSRPGARMAPRPSCVSQGMQGFPEPWGSCDSLKQPPHRHHSSAHATRTVKEGRLGSERGQHYFVHGGGRAFHPLSDALLRSGDGPRRRPDAVAQILAAEVGVPERHCCLPPWDGNFAARPAPRTLKPSRSRPLDSCIPCFSPPSSRFNPGPSLAPASALRT